MSAKKLVPLVAVFLIGGFASYLAFSGGDSNLGDTWQAISEESDYGAGEASEAETHPYIDDLIAEFRSANVDTPGDPDYYTIGGDYSKYDGATPETYAENVRSAVELLYAETYGDDLSYMVFDCEIIGYTNNGLDVFECMTSVADVGFPQFFVQSDLDNNVIGIRECDIKC